jgi:DNA-binding NarL/FixJ family response regulator
MARGEPRTALRVLHAAAHHTTATTVGGCMGAYASALAMLGDGVAAGAALAEARKRNRPTWTAFTRWAALTEITIAGTLGERSRALSLAWSAVADARGAGLPGFEFLAFHELVRLGGVTPAVVDRLAALAAVHEGVRVRLVHEQAEQTGSGEGLLKVADGYAEAGFTLFAAEATAQAAGAFRRAGSTRQRQDAETRAWALAARCQGADTPPLRGLAAPQLTPRQRQIVRLVAAGHSNREIAERLFLSKRTVDNHLVAIYERTGIQDRAGLIRLHEILT